MYPVQGPCVAALAAPGFHQADSQRAAPFACRLCQTLGVTGNMSVSRMHLSTTRKPSRPALQCVSAPAVRHVRAMPTLRSRPEVRLFVAVAKAVGSSLKRTTRASCHLRAKAFRAQFVPALARRRRQMLVSLWALPLSQGRRDLGSTVRCGSGLGSIQAVPRLPTVVTPNLSIEGTASGLRPPAAPHVKR